MTKSIIIFFVVAITIVTIYFLFFTPNERKAKSVQENSSKIKVGMSKAEVIRILSEPDTIYIYDTQTLELGDTIKVLQYNLGFGAPDGLRILTKRETVVDIISHH